MKITHLLCWQCHLVGYCGVTGAPRERRGAQGCWRLLAGSADRSPSPPALSPLQEGRASAVREGERCPRLPASSCCGGAAFAKPPVAGIHLSKTSGRTSPIDLPALHKEVVPSFSISCVKNCLLGDSPGMEKRAGWLRAELVPFILTTCMGGAFRE